MAILPKRRASADGRHRPRFLTRKSRRSIARTTVRKVVTALSDIIITVVTDDKAMKSIFGGGLLSRAKGKIFIAMTAMNTAGAESDFSKEVAVTVN